MAELTNVTAEEVTSKISGKYELYKAALRNGFYLPKLKSGIVTETYIIDVICGAATLPQTSRQGDAYQIC